MSRGKLSWTGAFPAVEADGVRRLTHDDLNVVFQPIVDVLTGRTFAQEALVRPKHPDYPSPPVLFEKAASEQACGRLGRIIRDNAFRSCGDVALFVNVHPDELTSRWLVQPDDPVGFHSKPVFLEITESTAFTHHELCHGVLKELCRRTGAQLVVDDFGAGYSNIERVIDLEPAVLKLDLALVRGIHQHRAKQAVVRHMVNLCKELGARVVAEGVETVEELSCVKSLGVDYVQGYLLARPGAPPPMPAWPLPIAPAASGAPAPRREPPPMPPRRDAPPRPQPAPAGSRPEPPRPAAVATAGAASSAERSPPPSLPKRASKPPPPGESGKPPRSKPPRA